MACAMDLAAAAAASEADETDDDMKEAASSVTGKDLTADFIHCVVNLTSPVTLR